MDKMLSFFFPSKHCNKQRKNQKAVENPPPTHTTIAKCKQDTKHQIPMLETTIITKTTAKEKKKKNTQNNKQKNYLLERTLSAYSSSLPLALALALALAYPPAGKLPKGLGNRLHLPPPPAVPVPESLTILSLGPNLVQVLLPPVLRAVVASRVPLGVAGELLVPSISSSSSSSPSSSWERERVEGFGLGGENWSVGDVNVGVEVGGKGERGVVGVCGSSGV
ncbi:hypothetical protein L873DRAFT_532474 [Choiromyces venosus 120613-1]|uniref:Uncharacterized protein n=1 Tax=Choiromyces venosus 120613-1 TaxID=1336337 RepID=A0A3N4K8B3_9PEZI|nr:hypothetical protein L873DRAFT_532474 [Choiromyces venosus 120613-1]